MLLGLIVWGGPARADLFSPGELAQKHAPLEGLSGCSACHPSGARLSAQKCLDCHTELAGQVARGAGYHGRLPAEQRDSCEKCHHDHLGREQPMTQWGPGGVKGFPHERTGWPLLGKHAQTGCDDCHQHKLLALSEVRAWVAKHPSCRTYLGAPKPCEGCHFDEHRGPLKGKCGDCHDAKAWAPAPTFSHARTRYKLKGKHVKVKCAACHPTVDDEQTPPGAFPAPRSTRYLKMSPLRFDTCVRCHQDDDVHDDRFGPRCESCHLEADWKQIKPEGVDRTSHDEYRYKLEGAHASVECKACHGPWPGKKARYKGLPFEKCTDCHDDAHLGQLAPPKDCSTCHTVTGFSPSTFDARAHADTRFPLEGAHRAVSCAGCHREVPALAIRAAGSSAQVSPRRFDFPGKLDRCESCHADVHAGQFPNQGCTSCHQADSFRALRFDHRRDSKFPLEGKHQKAACAGCHPVSERRGLAAARYKGVESVCSGCHRDVHLGQLGEPPDCARCHDEKGFEPSSFQHRPPFTEYLLEGGHQQVKCERCHPKVEVAKGESAARYRPLASSCSGCHADFHRGELKGFSP